MSRFTTLHDRRHQSHEELGFWPEVKAAISFSVALGRVAVPINT